MVMISMLIMVKAMVLVKDFDRGGIDDFGCVAVAVSRGAGADAGESCGDAVETVVVVVVILK